MQQFVEEIFATVSLSKHQCDNTILTVLGQI